MNELKLIEKAKKQFDAAITEAYISIEAKKAKAKTYLANSASRCDELKEQAAALIAKADIGYDLSLQDYRETTKELKDLETSIKTLIK